MAVVYNLATQCVARPPHALTPLWETTLTQLERNTQFLIFLSAHWLVSQGNLKRNIFKGKEVKKSLRHYYQKTEEVMSK